MKKLALIGFAFLLTIGLSAQTNDEKNASESTLNKKNEIGINIWGLFFGSYSARGETSLTNDGLFGLGLKGTYTNQSNYFGSGLTFQDTQGTLDFRVYPSRYRTGFFLSLEGGYWSESFSDSSGSVTLTGLPILAGLGWKWVINEFAIDLSFGLGRIFYLNDPTNGLFDINTFPYNIAIDSGLFVAYRF